MFEMVKRIFSKGETRSWPADYLQTGFYGGLSMLATYGRDTAGVKVTPETAMTASAVYACVSRIASDLATLPVHVFDRVDNSIIHDHPVSRLLRNPNDDMTPCSFWTAYAMNLLLWGNGYAYIDQAGLDRVSIYPILAKHITPNRSNGNLLYRHTAGTFSPWQIIHTPYLSLDGVNGISPIATGAQVIGTAIALNEFASRYFSQGSHLNQNAFELPPMSPEAIAEFRRIIREEYSGLDNSHKTLAMPGIKVHRLTDSMKDSQGIESREFQLREVCRLYKCPVGIIDAEKSTYGNLEAQYRNYAESCLRPFIVGIEQEFSRKLFAEDEQDRLTIRFNLDAVVRASLTDRSAADATLVNAGIITPNEAREHHDLPPKEGGQYLLSPLNMTSAASRSKPTTISTDTLKAQNAQLLQSIVSGIATKEANAIRRAKDRDGFTSFCDTFFTEHVEHIRTRIPTITPEKAQEYAKIAHDEIRRAYESGTLDTTLDGWETTRTEHAQKIFVNS